MPYAYTSFVDSQRCFRRRITVHHHNRNTTERVLCGGMYYTYSQSIPTVLHTYWIMLGKMCVLKMQRVFFYC